MTQDAFDAGCTCMLAPPCGFCTSLAEEEGDAFSSGGLSALIPFIGRMDNESYTMVKEKAGVQ